MSQTVSCYLLMHLKFVGVSSGNVGLVYAKLRRIPLFLRCKITKCEVTNPYHMCDNYLLLI